MREYSDLERGHLMGLEEAEDAARCYIDQLRDSATATGRDLSPQLDRLAKDLVGAIADRIKFRRLLVEARYDQARRAS